ncbi:hypothetical protein GOP47_0014225 [Adiantum capillus-veneris]|uniref:Transmembrane protein n=1 Tax=Adiantum capillus-veneris TaxID=13818 RepID=A0A9D4UQ18_ADICA|nr:hypothetical protein GOP47_0014225 [Adiantum capillus-veneris]
MSASSFRWALIEAFLCLSLLLASARPGSAYAISTHGMVLPSMQSGLTMADSLQASLHHTMKVFMEGPFHHTMRISDSDLQGRHALEQSFQRAAFEQFGSGKTGRIYNISVPSLPLGIVRAIRLRSGSFRRYGVIINEFTIPRGCKLQPVPKRILLVYAQLANTTLFQDLPQAFVLDSPVLSVLAYDAANLNATQPLESLNVSTGSKPITIQFAGSSVQKCASFDGGSTNVNYTDLVQGACEVTHFGAFALVSNAPVGGPPPIAAPVAVSPRLPTSRSNTWKIVVGSVVGGLALLVLLSLLAIGIASRRRKARFAKMEYQTDHGETLQTTTIGNSRVPAAGSTRTQSMIEREYTV